MEPDADSSLRVSILKSINRLHEAIKENPDTLNISRVLKSEFSKFGYCDFISYFRYVKESSVIGQIACSEHEVVGQTIYHFFDASTKWIDEQELGSLITLKNLDSAPNFLKELGTSYNIVSMAIFIGKVTESYRDLFILGSKREPDASYWESLENSAELLTAAALVVESSQTILDLRKIKSDIQLLFDLAPIAMIMCDSSGKVISANDQAELLLYSGQPEDSILGENLLENEHFEKSGISALIRRALEMEEVEGENIRFRNPGGKIYYLHMKFRPVPDINGKVRAVGVITDVSQRVRLQQQLERSYQTLTEAFHELQRVDKMKTQFIDVVSHELRTPLTVMRGYLEMLSSSILDDMDPKFVQKIENIRMNTEKLYEIVESMLDIARIEKGAMAITKQEASIEAILEQVIASQRPLAQEKQQNLQLVTIGELAPIKMDARKMHDAIRNIVNNAIKYSPEGGKIQVSVADEGKMIHIWVKDNGVGIPLSELNKIFDRFYIVAAEELSYQVNRMGLGLPIAKGIVESHGGKIWFESEVGKGSVFHINIPKE